MIGRKGSINNPIFVDTPLWNVDTAFGLIAKQEKQESRTFAPTDISEFKTRKIYIDVDLKSMGWKFGGNTLPKDYLNTVLRMQIQVDTFLLEYSNHLHNYLMMYRSFPLLRLTPTDISIHFRSFRKT